MIQIKGQTNYYKLINLNEDIWNNLILYVNLRDAYNQIIAPMIKGLCLWSEDSKGSMINLPQDLY